MYGGRRRQGPITTLVSGVMEYHQNKKEKKQEEGYLRMQQDQEEAATSQTTQSDNRRGRSMPGEKEREAWRDAADEEPPLPSYDDAVASHARRRASSSSSSESEQQPRTAQQQSQRSLQVPRHESGLDVPGRGMQPRPRSAVGYRETVATGRAMDPYMGTGIDPYALDARAGARLVRDPYMQDPYMRDPYMRDPYMADPMLQGPYLSRRQERRLERMEYHNFRRGYGPPMNNMYGYDGYGPRSPGYGMRPRRQGLVGTLVSAAVDSSANRNRASSMEPPSDRHRY